MKTRGFMFAVATAAMIVPARAQQAADDHLGAMHFAISCTAVQGKFDRAVALLHNFFYPETVKAFQTIIKEDPSCADRLLGSGDERIAQAAGAALAACFALKRGVGTRQRSCCFAIASFHRPSR